MSPVLSSPDDRNPSDDRKPDCPVSVIVPEEFAGSAMGQLSLHEGMIKEMDVRDGTVVIQALIPERRLAELARAVREYTQDRGRVERQPNVNG